MDKIEANEKKEALRVKTQSLEALERAITVSGAMTTLSKHIGTTAQLINRWRTGATLYGVGARFVLRIEAVTDVSRHDLRSDLYPRGKE